MAKYGEYYTCIFFFPEYAQACISSIKGVANKPSYIHYLFLILHKFIAINSRNNAWALSSLSNYP